MLRQQQAWVREYGASGTERIESSYTLEPERCVAWFKNWLRQQGVLAGHLLDAGCGRGRNSLPFLADGWKVTGVDIVSQALRDFKLAAGSNSRRLTLLQHDLMQRLPLTAGSFQAALEITVTDNLGQLRARDRFWRDLARVLASGGYLLSYYFTPQDGYYGSLLKNSPSRDRRRLYDQRAGMYFRFYTAQDILAATRGQLRLRLQKHYRYPGPMFGKRYQRDLVAAIFQRI